MKQNQNNQKQDEQQETINGKTEYEIKNGLRSQKELTPLMIDTIKELNNEDFHRFYDLLWTWTAKEMLYKHAKSDVERLRKDVAELKKEVV